MAMRWTVWGVLAIWGAPAAALTIGFEDARVDGGAVRVAGGVVSAVRGDVRGEAVGGGRLVVARGLNGLAPGLSGAALSTRDLSWPYGFSISLTRAASRAAAVWAAGDRDWRLRALDAGGETVAERVIAAGDAAFDVSVGPEAAGEGFTTLLFESVEGYDWIYMDALRLRPTEARGLRTRTVARVIAPPSAEPPGLREERPAVVPLPAGLGLAAAAFVGLFGWLGVRRRTPG